MITIQKLFGKKEEPKQPAMDIDVLFHKECNGMVEHGTIFASHAMHRLDKAPVRFAFNGLDKAPAMTPELMAHIWDRAEVKGYIPHALRSYGNIVTHIPAPVLATHSPSRRDNHTPVAVTPRRRADAPDRQNHEPVVN